MKPSKVIERDWSSSSQASKITVGVLALGRWVKERVSVDDCYD